MLGIVVEDQDGFLVEVSPEEARDILLPVLSPHERLKFEQMKDVYVAKASQSGAREGCYYFLVSRDGQAVKFESSALLTSDQSGRGGSIKRLPDIPVSKIEEVSSIDPEAY